MAVKCNEQSTEENTETQIAIDWSNILPAVTEYPNSICEIIITTLFIRYLTQYKHTNR